MVPTVLGTRKAMDGNVFKKPARKRQKTVDTRVVPTVLGTRKAMDGNVFKKPARKRRKV